MTEIKTSETINSPQLITLSNEFVTTSINKQGALLSSLEIDGISVIYEPTEDNHGRGGVPVLGPTPGPVKGESWESIYPKSPSHGLDRKSEWNILSKSDEKLELSRHIGPNEFLFAGEIKMIMEISSTGLIISKTITNHEDKPREIGHGFHPYYPNENTKWDKNILTDEIKEKLINKEAVILPGINNTKIEIDGQQFSVESSPNPEQTVLWTDNFDKYLCFEPWWATIGGGIVIAPRESKTFSLSISKTE